MYTWILSLCGEQRFACDLAVVLVVNELAFISAKINFLFSYEISLTNWLLYV